MALQPIESKTRLNSNQFSYISSGGPDYYLEKETSENIKPWPINEHAFKYIPRGDRYTFFLNRLFTNYFLIDLDFLAVGKTASIHFSTTSDFSFSLTRYGNRPKDVDKDIYLSENAKKWGQSTIRNLAEYFKEYPEGKILDFNFIIHKTKSYRLEIEVYVYDPDVENYLITFDGDVFYTSDNELFTVPTGTITI